MSSRFLTTRRSRLVAKLLAVSLGVTVLALSAAGSTMLLLRDPRGVRDQRRPRRQSLARGRSHRGHDR